jgi:hypothetical protein
MKVVSCEMRFSNVDPFFLHFSFIFLSKVHIVGYFLYTMERNYEAIHQQLMSEDVLIVTVLGVGVAASRSLCAYPFFLLLCVHISCNMT